MKRLESLAATKPFWPSAGGAEALWTLPHESEKSDAFGSEIALVEFEPRWRPSEDEIVRAAIVVIFVALTAIMALAAGAIVTMG